MAEPTSLKKREYQYFRVVITYSDGETSGNRVVKDLKSKKAEWWAARQEASPVVRKVAVEPFTRQHTAKFSRSQAH